MRADHIKQLICHACWITTSVTNHAQSLLAQILSLVEVLYECAVSPTPVDYGPLAAKAMLNICQVIILACSQPLPQTCDQLFSEQQLGVIQDTCGQLASPGSAATALVCFWRSDAMILTIYALGMTESCLQSN